MSRIQPLQCSPEIESSAQKTNSKNGILKELHGHVNRYNGFLPNLVKFKEKDQNYLLPAYMVETLDKICLSCMAYLLYRPAHLRKTSGQKKWQDVLQIQQTIMKHADFFGIRVLRGDYGENPDANYWLERVLPVEQPLDRNDAEFFELTARADAKVIGAYENWTSKGFNDDCRESFVEVLKSLPRGESHLKYFTDLARQNIAVECVNSRVKMHWQEANDFLDTKGEGASGYSGLNNVFIYACSALTNTVYTTRGEENVTHHSSFLRGEPVLAAGDWLIVNGEVKFVNAESGHYRPTLENMRLFATKFKQFWNPNTLIQPEHHGRIVKMSDFIAFGKGVLSAPEALIAQIEPLVGMGKLQRKK